MNTLDITNKILKENKLIAKKSYGQNFLVDDEILRNIVEQSNVKEEDTVIEIGPGLGNLTKYILDKKAKVYAFEIDEDMIEVLNKRFKDERLTIINKDILKADIREYSNRNKLKIIANIPYYITTPIIFKLLEYRDIIESITIMIQKEVAERITAKPHSKDYGILTINTNVLGDVEYLFDVPNESFIPAPRVTSAVIKIIPNMNKQKELKIENIKTFEELVKKAFSQRRKKLVNSLLNAKFLDMNKEQIEKVIEQVGLNENVRAEEIDISTYVKMANIINKEVQIK